MPNDNCCVCGQPGLKSVGRRWFCDEHYQSATKDRSGFWRSTYAQVGALVVFVGLVYLGTSFVKPAFTSASLLLTGAVLAIVPALIWLIFTTALAEGAGLVVALAALFDTPARGALGYFSLALIARALAWSIYRGGAAKIVVRAALVRLERSGKILIQFGTIAPLALLLAAWFAPDAARILVLLAGIAALATGWQFKFVLITRAAYNQGFALPHLPVRGTR